MSSIKLLILGCGLFLASIANALDLATTMGFKAKEQNINAGAGIAYLPNGDILAFSADYSNGPSLLLVDGNTDGIPASPTEILHFDTSYYPSFVRVAPNGKFALIGLSGASSDIRQVDLDTYAITTVANVPGNYDLDFIDNQHVYISSNPGGFDESAPNLIYWLDLENSSSLKTIISVQGTPSGPIALNAAGDLYYVKSTWQFPAPTASSTLLCFPRNSIEEALQLSQPLGTSDSSIQVAINGGYDLAVESSSSGNSNDRIYIAALGEGIVRYDRKNSTFTTLLSSANQAADNASFTGVALLKRSTSLTGCSLNGNKLIAAIASHYYSDNTIAEVIPTITDIDKDGFNDCIESLLQSDLNDRGSIPPILSSPAYSTWNGFLGMINILELINRSASQREVTVSLFGMNGRLTDSFTTKIEANSQKALILNERPGFKENSYGLVKVNFTDGIEGQVSFYKSSSPTWGESYDFAYSLPLVNALHNSSSVGFNTNFPGSAVVANWLSIINLGESKQDFTVTKYDGQGNVLRSRTYTLRARERRDLEGGHVEPGLNQVGLITVQPKSTRLAYLAQLVRYGYEADSSTVKFAFPILAQAESKQTIGGFISNKEDTLNYLEVLNPSSRSTRAQVNCYTPEGSSIYDRSIPIRAHAQVHLPASSFLASTVGTGHCTIKDTKGNALLAYSMYYYPRSGTTEIVSLSGETLRETLGSNLTGGYNLFLNMNGKLLVANLNSDVQPFYLDLYRSSGSRSNKIYSKLVSLAAHETMVFDLSNSSTFRTLANSYGVISVRSGDGRGLLASSIRERRSTDDGSVEFSIPTSVK